MEHGPAQEDRPPFRAGPCKEAGARMPERAMRASATAQHRARADTSCSRHPQRQRAASMGAGEIGGGRQCATRAPDIAASGRRKAGTALCTAMRPAQKMTLREISYNSLISVHFPNSRRCIGCAPSLPHCEQQSGSDAGSFDYERRLAMGPIHLCDPIVVESPALWPGNLVRDYPLDACTREQIVKHHTLQGC